MLVVAISGDVQRTVGNCNVSDEQCPLAEYVLLLWSWFLVLFTAEQQEHTRSVFEWSGQVVPSFVSMHRHEMWHVVAFWFQQPLREHLPSNRVPNCVRHTTTFRSHVRH